VQEGNELLLRDSQIEDLNDFFFHHLIIENMMCKAMAAINFHMTCKKMIYVIRLQDPNVNIGNGCGITNVRSSCDITDENDVESNRCSYVIMIKSALC
jgi:hypothetical protein